MQQNQNFPSPSPLIFCEFPTVLGKDSMPILHVHRKEKCFVFLYSYSHSKWLKVVPMITRTSEKTMEVLGTISSTYSLLEVFVSDNDPQFTSTRFQKFMYNNDAMCHLYSTLYHPATNGNLSKQYRHSKETWKRLIAHSNFENPVSISTNIAHNNWCLSC